MTSLPSPRTTGTTGTSRSAMRRRRTTALLLSVGLLASACGGKGAGEASGDAGPETTDAEETGLDTAGEPVRGGTVVYGLEAETGGGWCLPDAQLAISGIMVARAVYDTLTVPNDDGGYVPWLAERVEPNQTYDEWTITLREGVEFHDGSALDAEVVKNNLDAFRGRYPGRTAGLGSAVFHNVDTVEVVDPRTVRVTTHVPWVAFPAYLWGSGRFGMMAQDQLDDREHCNEHLIGTGPFSFEEWIPNQSLEVSRNQRYWLDAPDGKPYPYLERVEFRPIVEAEQRVNALEAGEIQALHTSGPAQTLRVRGLVADGRANAVESSRFAEVLYLLLNASEPPFDDLRIRRALQVGLDRERLDETVFEGLPERADGPFADGVTGHLDDTGWPERDADEARRLVEEYRVEKGLAEVSLRLTVSAGPENEQIAVALQADAKELNLDLEIVPIEQSQLISTAIGGDYQAMLFRNHPGGDPDTQYVWWKAKIQDAELGPVDNVINFGRIDDAEIDELLERGRSEADPDVREELYEDVNRQFAEGAWNIWLNYIGWTVATAETVHGIIGPDLPDGSAPSSGLATGHTLLGMWNTDV